MTPNSAVRVILTPEAETDLVSIYACILRADGRDQAQKIKDQLKNVIRSRQSLPARGKCPPEMHLLGVDDFRELQSAPWRIFYYMDQDAVNVVAVLDGRRNIPEVLRKRLLQ